MRCPNLVIYQFGWFSKKILAVAHGEMLKGDNLLFTCPISVKI